MYYTKKSTLHYLLYIIYVKSIYNGFNVTAADYQIEKILPQNKSNISAFLNAMNIEKYSPNLDENVVDVVDKGYSYSAVAENGTILAVLLMGPGFVNQSSLMMLKKAIENRQMDHYYREELLKFHYRILKSNHSLETVHRGEAMHFHIAATSPTARRHGIMRRLFQHGSEIARQNGYGLITCICENQQVENLCLSLNWSCIFRKS